MLLALNMMGKQDAIIAQKMLFFRSASGHDALIPFPNHL
jgi:hypothetical protein